MEAWRDLRYLLIAEGEHGLADEQPLTIEGVTKYPDFTIEDMESGLTYYWV